MKEKWAEFKIGDNTILMVSDSGRVKNARTGHEYVASKDRLGYIHVSLHINGKSYYPTVHRLVAKSFIPNPKGLKEVNHIDGKKDNNTVRNLEWVSPSENMKHAYRTGLKKPSGGERPRKIVCKETGEIFESIHAAARRFGKKSTSSFYWGLSSVHHKTYGFHWEYIDKGETM